MAQFNPEKRIFQKGTWKHIGSEPIVYDGVEIGQTSYGKIVYDDPIAQERKAQDYIYLMSSNWLERRVNKEMVEQQLGRRPLKPILELGEYEKMNPAQALYLLFYHFSTYASLTLELAKDFFADKINS